MIEYWIYELKAGGPLGKGGATTFEGALIRVDGMGHACLHPWPSLGDEPLAEQLQILRDGGETMLIRQTRRCAEIDGQARRGGRNLLLDVPRLRNHWQWRPWADPLQEAEEIAARASGSVKVKADSMEMGATLLAMVRAFVPSTRVRVDFNTSLTSEEALHWWNSLSEEERDLVELVEDPSPPTPEFWAPLAEAGMPLALDQWNALDDLPHRFRVVKPARDEVWSSAKTTIVTSYLDHPLGQLWALQQATAHGASPKHDHGLASHPMFEPNEFSERLLIAQGGVLIPPAEGTGLGFDDLLAQLPWKDLAKL